ncbi:diaminopimelate epimerase [Sphingorhabdus sp. Alg239-R122]|uniref:diaminopimelate epimerase n=1 Tax=Sphingorhabdus sp. Alg239-R122 TaxID=2305989 RepID=UPI0013D8F775|nr:diaminopimelate epimerase [Sphingorhabdus sp. Alg239-R122]
MAKTAFHKMHGLGNDFIIFDGRENPLALDEGKVRQLADRHGGIGCDQLIVLHASDKADVRMQIFNHDGGEVEACGNASRCVVTLLDQDVSIETDGGVISGELTGDAARVNMGVPRFDWQEIPLDYAMDTANMPVSWGDLRSPAAVNVGNPHVIFFVGDGGAVDLGTIGPDIEHDPLFPERINVNVAHIKGGEIYLRVWERGAGLTKACGTGACATAVAAISRKLVSSPVKVHLPGGMLQVEWDGANAPIHMAGPATYVFSGEIDLDTLT